LASIYQATYAVVFFGTPHRGSEKASLGVIAATVCKAIGKETNTSLLRSLETSSEILVRISEAFAKLLANREVRVHSFLEDLSVPMVGKVRNCPVAALVRKGRKLTREQVVEEFSGRIGDAYEGLGRIPADHREMVRFNNAHETGYRRVLDVVEQFVEDAAEAVRNGSLPKELPVHGV
jgi:hypothetical protein